jgi:hypothetical protein
MNGREPPPHVRAKVADVELAEEPQLVEGGPELDRSDRMAGVRGARQQVGSELQYRMSGGHRGMAPADRLEAHRQRATHHLRAGLQLRAVPGRGGATAGDPNAAQALAQKGLSGTGGGLPHGAAIQRSFGKHDVSQIRAHAGPEAKAATQELGAKAYASGDQVAFGGGGAADLHTAAHEAAHVVQQRDGVQLAGGVGRDGDDHERHADAVADRVVNGQSAEALLDAAPGRGGGGAGAGVQRKSSEAALQFARPADKAAAQALETGVIGKKPPKLKKGERSGGTSFGNKEGLLPKDAAGKAVTYTEYDVNAYDGVNRDAERLVVGSDGRCWYTADHYKSFTEIK